MNGQFILDLSLSPPPPSPGIASDSDRKNLALHTTSGPISADILIRPHGRTKSKRVSLGLSSSNGTVRAIVVRLSHTILVPSLDEIRHSTTLSPSTGTGVRFHSSTSSYVPTTETYTSHFLAAFAGQSPSAPVTTGLPFLLRSKDIQL